MKDRIQQIIDYKGVSPGDLAEILDVQRSNISHILNGRNKPGAVFIEKLLQAYPNINARWLLTGEGQMVMNEAAEEVTNSSMPGSDSKVPSNLHPPSDRQAKIPSVPDKGKTIDKIVLLYSDGSFTFYTNH